MSHHSGSKKAVSTEVIGLRKQVADLKESALERRRVEDALRAAESLHRSTLEEAPVGIIRLDPAGRLIYANAAFAALLGYETRHDFNTIGELRGIFLHSEESRRVVELAGKAGQITARCVSRDGKEVAVQLLGGRGGGGEEGVTLVAFPE